MLFLGIPIFKNLTKERANTRMRARYVNISIHEELAKQIDEYIRNSKLGFRSRAEVVSDAVRRLMSKKI